MSKNEVSINLTPAFLVWTLVFGVIALFTTSWTWFAVALLPWFAVAAFMLIFAIFAGVSFGIAYLSGTPIKVTNYRTGSVRYIQRKR